MEHPFYNTLQRWTDRTAGTAFRTRSVRQSEEPDTGRWQSQFRHGRPALNGKPAHRDHFSVILSNVLGISQLVRACKSALMVVHRVAVIAHGCEINHIHRLHNIELNYQDYNETTYRSAQGAWFSSCFRDRLETWQVMLNAYVTVYQADPETQSHSNLFDQGRFRTQYERQFVGKQNGFTFAVAYWMLESAVSGTFRPSNV